MLRCSQCAKAPQRHCTCSPDGTPVWRVQVQCPKPQRTFRSLHVRAKHKLATRVVAHACVADCSRVLVATQNHNAIAMRRHEWPARDDLPSNEASPCPVVTLHCHLNSNILWVKVVCPPLRGMRTRVLLELPLWTSYQGSTAVSAILARLHSTCGTVSETICRTAMIRRPDVSATATSFTSCASPSYSLIAVQQTDMLWQALLRCSRTTAEALSQPHFRVRLGNAALRTVEDGTLRK